MKTTKGYFGFLQIIILSVSVISLVFVQSVWSDYPEKPINLIVGYKAGGATDAMARMLGKSMQKQLGQPVLAINKPGGGGSLAASIIKKSKPNGYNIAVTATNAYTFIPHFMALQKKATFRWNDFEHLATVGQYQLCFVGPPSVKDWKDLISLGRKKGELSMAGMSPLDRMLSRYIAKKEGITIKFVPFKGGAETMAALLGGHTDFAFSGGLHVKYTAAGKMKVLAAFGSKRLANYPEAPTLKELGYGIAPEGAIILSLPKGTPDDIIEKLERVVAKAVEGREYREFMSKIRFPIVFRGHKELSQYMSRQDKEMLHIFQFLKQ